MAVSLTADICAAAIVASARVYGDHPVKAMVAKAGRNRRSLAAAATAIVAQTGRLAPVVCNVLGLGRGTYDLAARMNTGEYQQAVKAAVRAIAGLSAADIAEPRRTRPVPPRRTGTIVAPPPVASETPPTPARPAVDHRPAIAEALARQKARSAGPAFEVVGVEADRALIGATAPGGCVWPMGDPRDPGYRSCQAQTLAGRLYCAEHLKKAGMKPVAKTIAVVGRVAQPYVDREAG